MQKVHRMLVASYDDERARLARDPDVVHGIQLIRLRDLFGQRLKGSHTVKYL